MPFIDTPEVGGLRASVGKTPAPETYDANQVIPAAFRQGNILVSALQGWRNSGAFSPVENYSAIDELRGTPYADRYLSRFVGSESPAETAAIKRQIDQEEADRRTLQASGAPGAIVEMVAGVLDPTIFLPGSMAVKAGNKGWSATRAALGIGQAAALQLGVQESILRGTQQTRTATESVVNVATGTLLAALLGSAAAKLLTPAEAKGLTELLERDREAMRAHTGLAEGPSATGVPNTAPAPPPQAAPAGAAATDARTLELVPSGLNKVTAGFDPMSRIFNSTSVAGRRAAADLAETPLLMKQNLAGETTALDGPPIGRVVTLTANQTRIAVGDELDRLFMDMRFGGDVRAPRVRAWFEDKFGEGGMTMDAFKREVAVAMQEGDVHAIPQVQEAARYVRGVFETWGKRAEAAIPEFKMKEFDEGQSYFPHVFNKEAIKAKRPEFTNVVVAHLKADQDVKLGIKDKLTGLTRELANTGERIERAVKAKQPEVAARLQIEHDALRAKIEAEVARWEGVTTAEAKAAIKAREKYATEHPERKFGAKEPPRLTQADAAVDKAVRDIIKSDRDLDIEALRAKANEITDHVLGTPDGRLPYDLGSGGPRIGRDAGGEPLRGSLHSRDFAIPTAAIRDFIENDIEHVLNVHLRTVVPDVLIAERFGDTRMTEALRRIQDEFAAKIDAAGPDPKARSALGKEQETVIASLALIRDRIRGVYGSDIRAAMPMLARAVDAAKNYNVLTSMGVAALSSLPDAAGVVFRHGFTTTFRDAWAPYFRGLFDLKSASREQTRQLRAMGIVVETDLSMRHREMNDIMDAHKPQSRLERSLQWGADKFQLVNMLAHWTDRAKAWAGGVAMAEILRAAEAVAKGKATARQIRTLGEGNISASMAGRIWEAYSAPGAGQKVDGVHLPNTGTWADREARLAFEAAVAREADIAVVTPGQEKPGWLSNPVLGVLGQFKSFTAASTTRVLIANLQRRDAQTLQGLVLSVGLGMMSYKLNSLAGGQPTSDSPGHWIKEGISRGGVLGWLEEGNALASKATGGSVDLYRAIGAHKPLSRYVSRNALDHLLGPTAGKVESLLKASSAAGRMDWGESDSKAIRRLMAGQNLFWLRGILNQVEAGANGAFGIPMKAKPE